MSVLKKQDILKVRMKLVVIEPLGVEKKALAQCMDLSIICRIY